MRWLMILAVAAGAASDRACRPAGTATERPHRHDRRPGARRLLLSPATRSSRRRTSTPSPETSVRLTDFHVAPMCSPTRGQLLTGLAALRNGATSVTAGRTFLRPGLPDAAGAVRARRATRPASSASGTSATTTRTGPIDKGFQESVYHLGWGQLHSTPEFDWPLIDGRYFHNGVEKRFKGHCTDFWFDSAMAWMKECKRQGRAVPLLPADERPARPAHRPGGVRQAVPRARAPAGFFGMIAHIDKRSATWRSSSTTRGWRTTPSSSS